MTSLLRRWWDTLVANGDERRHMTQGMKAVGHRAVSVLRHSVFQGDEALAGRTRYVRARDSGQH